MPTNPNKLSQFWQELKRRRVIHVIIVYATAAFVIIELVNNVFEPLSLPEWTPTLVILILAIGFPLAVIFSWIFDVTPEGIEKTKPAKELQKGEKTMVPNSWRIATYVSVVVIIGLIAFNIFSGKRGARIDESLAKSIAVLPFENMSDESEFVYLGDAITDEIIMQLYKIQEFEVRSRTSIMQYKNTEKRSPVIGQELNVNYLLEGATQRYEDQVRIRVQLIQASTDDHIWGEVFEGDWQDIFEIQISVAKQVANELKTVLSLEEVESIENEPTANIEAYTLYLKGRYFYSQDSKDDLDISMELYKSALEIDPEYALVYSGMAATLTSYATWGYSPRKDVMFKAKEAAIKALEIDNTLGEAHTELAWARVIHDWDWEEGEKGFKRAITLNPNYPGSHAKYGYLLTFLKRHEEAISEFERALELDPLFDGAWVRLGRGYYFAREYDRAIEKYRKAIELFPSSAYAKTHLVLALSQKGLHNEAIELGANLEDYHSYYWYLGYVFGIAGKKEKALEVLNYYLELSEKEFVWPASIAFIYIGLGEKDMAFEWLEITYKQGEGWLDLLQVEPMYDNLRSDPRFQDLIDRMNFPDN